MPRRSRIDAAGALHHVMVRGIERAAVFQSDGDRDHFLERLGEVLDETITLCYSWALIPNHFHLLLRTGPVPISAVMRRLLTGYALWFNRRHRRYGHLFQNRFKSILCQRSLLCYWAVRELGVPMSSLARRLGISILSVSESVSRGWRIAETRGCLLLGT